MKGEGRMLNGIWMAMIVLAFVGAVCTGRWTALSAAAADGARQAVETVLLLLGAMCLWTGIMRIAGEAGLTNGLSKILSPVIKRLFPNYGKNETVREKISMNIAANMLGMGNAATPFGLSARSKSEITDGRRADARDDLIRRGEYGVVSADPLGGGHLKGFLRQRGPV